MFHFHVKSSKHQLAAYKKFQQRCFIRKPIPRRHLLLKVNIKNLITSDVVLVSLVLTLNRFHTLFWCFHCWLRTSKHKLASHVFYTYFPYVVYQMIATSSIWFWRYCYTSISVFRGVSNICGTSCDNISQLRAVNNFCKTLHCRCLTEP